MIISKEVKEALKNHQPVVVLESTIISHGMPYPKNVETALKVEEEIRKVGVIPATIGIIEGEAIVGMSKDQIEQFGQRKGIVKCSRRDLPIVYATKKWGATTVAVTMIIAAMAGIKIFVTGGIGGVHRGVNETMDISADLIELATTPVMVICAGIKAILDLPRTLEYLETMGVTVVGYQSDNLGDFYTRDSHLKVDGRVDTPEAAARLIKAKEDYSLRGGILVSNPIPEKESLDEKMINKAIEEALKDAEKEHKKKKKVTPYLLSKVTELTKGDSLKANIALILNNAALGAKIAKEYYLLHD